MNIVSAPLKNDIAQQKDIFRLASTLFTETSDLYSISELQEAYDLIDPAVEKLSETFSSWDEATENYMDGYAYWSRTDVNAEGTSYRYRLGIYEDLKVKQDVDGILFDPTVWNK